MIGFRKELDINMEWAEQGPRKRKSAGFKPSNVENHINNDENNYTTDKLLINVIENIGKERDNILSDEKLSPKSKLKLLESNHKTLILLTGGKITHNENLLYGILIFAGIMILVLTLLTIFAKLPVEITLTFIGTVVGGTIATLAQKIEKINQINQ